MAIDLLMALTTLPAYRSAAGKRNELVAAGPTRSFCLILTDESVLGGWCFSHGRGMAV